MKRSGDRCAWAKLPNGQSKCSFDGEVGLSQVRARHRRVGSSEIETTDPSRNVLGPPGDSHDVRLSRVPKLFQSPFCRFKNVRYSICSLDAFENPVNPL